MKNKYSRQSKRELVPGELIAAILAGGRSKRMGGGFKALLELAGRPLARHVAERLEPQAAHVILSVEAVSPELDELGLAQVPDPRPGSHGPLGGLAAALRHAAENEAQWLLLAPCDAPFLPTDLGLRLSRAALAGDSGVAVARHGDRIHPTFSLWHTRLLADIETAVLEEGRAGFFQFLRGRRVDIMEWLPREPDPFFNINDRAALETAGRIVAETEGSEP